MTRDTSLRTLFQCATMSPERALLLWREWTREVPFEELTDPERRLLPAVWKNLSQEFQNFPGCHQLRGMYRLTWARNLQKQKCCEQVLESLGRHDIPALVLKGIALNITVYEDLGTRPAHDFDLLVPFSQARLALDLLLEEGWSLSEQGEGVAPELRLRQATALVKKGFEFDLHWFALREAREPRWDIELWKESIPLRVGTVDARMLSPDHQLMHLLVNGTREPENCYRFLLDLKLFLARYREELDLKKVYQLLRERHLLHRLSYLPLEEIEATEIGQGVRAGLFDRLWSWCSRYVHDGSGEILFGVFPFVDYYLHFRGKPDSPLTWGQYMKIQLELQDWRDFLHRLWHKTRRSL